MRKRFCDRCNEIIPKEFYKVSKSSMVKGNQQLIHVGDLCDKCWRNIGK